MRVSAPRALPIHAETGGLRDEEAERERESEQR
jgi:hypothetical protein